MCGTILSEDLVDFDDDSQHKKVLIRESWLLTLWSVRDAFLLVGSVSGVFVVVVFCGLGCALFTVP
jgi:hypothetical protein